MQQLVNAKKKSSFATAGPENFNIKPAKERLGFERRSERVWMVNRGIAKEYPQV